MRGRCVYDLIYNPLETRLLAWARAAGLEAIDGLEMLVSQAVHQSVSSAWTGRAAPRALFAGSRRKTVHRTATCGITDMKQTHFRGISSTARVRAPLCPCAGKSWPTCFTPVSAFLKIAGNSDYAFLLESVEGGEQVGRYSFLGKDPFLIVRSVGGQTCVEQAGVEHIRPEPYLDVVRELMAEFQAPSVPDLPRFTGGAVGI